MDQRIAVAESVAALRTHVAAWRAAGETVALVPTMGALHAGHAALVRLAAARADRVVVSVFVNPTQFAPNEDFSRYPRTFEADCEKAADAGAHVVFAPAVEEMYPDGFSTTISLSGPAAAGLEDRFRPTHFAGVATVCAKLFIAAAPDIAVFGEKDWQQLQVVTRMVADLGLPMTIVPGETVREADGLALSSRNRYLSETERATAVTLSRALRNCGEAIRSGRPVAEAVAQAAAAVTQAGFALDYLEARHPATLAPVIDGTGPIRILVAAKLGATRLIDNMAV